MSVQNYEFSFIFYIKKNYFVPQHISRHISRHIASKFSLFTSIPLLPFCSFSLFAFKEEEMGAISCSHEFHKNLKM